MMIINHRRVLQRLAPILPFFLFGVLTIASAEAITFKIATLSPDGSSWMKIMREGAAEVKQKTDGRVRFKFYPGGVMGNEVAILRKMRIGQLQGGAITSGSLSGFYPDNQIYNLPVQFNSYDEVDHVRAQMDQTIVDGLYQNGIVTFGLAEAGFAYLMSQNAITEIDTLRQSRIWMPTEDAMALATALAFDLAPVPLSAAEVRTGLQTGLIDTLAASPIIAIALRWHTQIGFVTDTPMIYIYGVLAIDRRAYEKLSPEDQHTVRSVMGAAWRKIDRLNRRENVEALEALRSRGVRFVEMAPQDKQELQRIASTVPERMIESGQLSRSIVDRFNRYLTEYREGRKTAK